MKRPGILIIVFALSLIAEVLGHCTVCDRCVDCSSAVKADDYIDEIDALLQKRIEDLGYPVNINRTTSSTQNIYLITYSSGLGIKLALQLKNMQIQLLSYGYNTATSTTSTTPTVTTTTTRQTQTVKKTSDGYTIVNVNDDATVKKITSFL